MRVSNSGRVLNPEATIQGHSAEKPNQASTRYDAVRVSAMPVWSRKMAKPRKVCRRDTREEARREIAHFDDELIVSV